MRGRFDRSPDLPARAVVDMVSNHNYIMYGGGKPILGLVVTIEPTEDLVALDGMSMQLNCYSPAGAVCVYQQYVTGLDRLSKSKKLHVGSSIENFPSDAYRKHLHLAIGLHAKGDLFNEHFHFGKFPGPGARIPAGWKLKWELFNDPNDPNDPSGAITGARYSVITDKGEVQTSGRQMIRRFKFSNTSVPVAAESMAPIFAFEMNMVGGNNGQFRYVTGAGTITYEAPTLTPLGKSPAGLAVGGTHTAEKSNIRLRRATPWIEDEDRSEVSGDAAFVLRGETVLTRFRNSSSFDSDLLHFPDVVSVLLGGCLKHERATRNLGVCNRCRDGRLRRRR